MKKAISRVFVAGSLLAAAFAGSPAHATDVAVCQVSGTVSLVKRSDPTIPLPLNDVPRKGAYKFIDTNITCNGTISATYKVTAQGTTAGFPDSTQGEDCNAGQNDANSGTLNNQLQGTKISGTGPSTITGNVAFTRLGSLVTVSGGLVGGGNNYSYAATLNFTPGNRVNDLPNPDTTQALGCLPGIDGGVTTAALDGTAEIVAI